MERSPSWKAKSSVVRKFPVLCRSCRFSYFLHKPTAGTHPQQHESSQYTSILFEIHYNILLLLSESFNHLFLSGFPTKTPLCICCFFNVCLCPSNLASFIWLSKQCDGWYKGNASCIFLSVAPVRVPCLTHGIEALSSSTLIISIQLVTSIQYNSTANWQMLWTYILGREWWF